MTESWRTLTAARDPLQADIFRSQLEAAGFKVFLKDELTVTANWLYSYAIGGVKIQVPQSEYQEAVLFFDSLHQEQPRYTDQDLPAERYIPGLQKPSERPKQSFENVNVFHYGLDLFNHGYWWEAHEAFEQLWQKEQNSVPKTCLQGLIKLCAAYLKWQAGSEQGRKSLYQGALEHFKQVLNEQSHCLGLDIEQIIEAFEVHFSQNPEEIDPIATHPNLELL